MKGGIDFIYAAETIYGNYLFLYYPAIKKADPDRKVWLV
jgi:hypothetical protein